MIRFVEERGNLDFLSADSHNDYMVMAFTSHLTETHLLISINGIENRSRKEALLPLPFSLSLSLSLELVSFISKYLKLKPRVVLNGKLLNSIAAK